MMNSMAFTRIEATYETQLITNINDFAECLNQRASVMFCFWILVRHSIKLYTPVYFKNYHIMESTCMVHVYCALNLF